MEPVFRTDPRFAPLWDRFREENDHVSVFYARSWLEYQRLYSHERLVEDLSFVLVDPGEQPLALCPLFAELCDGMLSFTCGCASFRTFAPSVRVHPKHRKKIEREVFRVIDELAESHGIQKSCLSLDPLSMTGDDAGYNLLVRYGFLDTSSATRIIPVSDDEADLRASLRSSYKAEINKADRAYETVVVDHETPDRSIHEEYRRLHHKAAGRVTRPRAAFDQQFAMLQADEAMVVGARLDGEFVGFAYFIHGGSAAYYASAADDPDAEVAVPVGPLLQWKAIHYYHDRGFAQLEIGQQHHAPQLFHLPSAKERAISFFKRGFGGRTRSLYQGVKYYDRDVMEREIRQRADRLIAAIASESE